MCLDKRHNTVKLYLELEIKEFELKPIMFSIGTHGPRYEHDDEA